MLLVLFIFFDPLAKKLFWSAKTFFPNKSGDPEEIYFDKKGFGEFFTTKFI